MIMKKVNPMDTTGLPELNRAEFLP
jgi:hypothetical protein